MDFEQQLVILKQRVSEVFADVSYPKRAIATHDCDECNKLGMIFERKNWKTIDPKIVDENFDKLPLFSSEAFHYFLPAYLLYSLENFSDKNDVCQFTVYSLNLQKKELRETSGFYKERFKVFTSEQMEVIYDFLYLIKDLQKDGKMFEFYGINVERLKTFRKSIDEQEIKS